MLTIQWMNEHGVYSAPFNAGYYHTDRLGYLDILRKGGDMEEIRILDEGRRDVTSRYL